MIIKSIKIRGFNLERVWRESSPSFETNSYSNERIDVTFGEKRNEISNFHASNRAKEFATNWTIVVSFLRPKKRGIHLYTSPRPPLLNLFRVFLQFLPSLPFHPFYHTSPPFSPLSASFFEISLWFTATLPPLFSSPLAVYLVIFSCFSPSLFSVCDDPSFLFFFPSDFPPQRTLFSPSLPPSSFLARYGANPRFRRGNVEIEHRNEPIEEGHCVRWNRCVCV